MSGPSSRTNLLVESLSSTRLPPLQKRQTADLEGPAPSMSALRNTRRVPDGMHGNARYVPFALTHPFRARSGYRAHLAGNGPLAAAHHELRRTKDQWRLLRVRPVRSPVPRT